MQTSASDIPPRLLTLANLVTMGSLASGFLIITSSLDASFRFAGPLFLVCVLCDGLDGYVARKTSTAGALGLFLDSLVDIVAFGVAPVVLAACFLRARGAQLPLWAGFLYLSCIALRLSRFNIQEDKTYFTGLNSPSAAALVVLCIWNVESASEPWVQQGAEGLILGSVVFAGLLMVAPCEYVSSKKLPGGWAVAAAVLAAAAVSLMLSRNIPLVLYSLALLYAASGPIGAALGRRRAQRTFG